MTQYTAYIANGFSVKIITSLAIRSLNNKVAKYLLNNEADKVAFEVYPYGPRKLYNLDNIKGIDNLTTKRLMFAEWLSNGCMEVI